MNRRAECSKNAGMTLVELLVAIIILAIIVVPLLHSMVSAVRMGAKAKKHLKATTAAQDIMEGLKAETLENLSCSFNYPDDAFDPLSGGTIVTTDDSFQNFWLVSPMLVGGKESSKLYELRADIVEDENLASYRSVSHLTDISASRNTNLGNFGSHDDALADLAPSTKKTDDNLGYEFYRKSNQKYYYAIQDMRVENDNGDPSFVVDAMIELDGSNYTTAGAFQKTSRVPGKDEVLLNEQGRILYRAADEKRDAFFIEDEILASGTAQEFNAIFSPATECTAKDLSKKYVLETVNHSAAPGGEKAADGADWVTVTCKLTYTSSSSFLIPNDSPYYDAVKGGNQPYTRTYEYTIFDNKATGYPLENVYLCYYPGYGNHTRDEIIYVNADMVPATLHLVKQEKVNNGTLNSDELHYECKVSVQEGLGASADHAGVGSRSDSVTDIRTNLDTNMYRIYLPSAPNVKQASFFYNGTVLNRSLSDESVTRIYSLGGEEEKSGQIFDVTIDIYKEGTLQKGLSGTGSIESEDILFTLKGSMN